MQPSTKAITRLQMLPQHWRNVRRSKAYLITLVAMLTILSATVAIGQSSANFDLACRSIISSGNQTMTNPGANLAVIGTLGLPLVPPKDSDTTPTYAIRNATHAVRAGFLPGYPNQAIDIAAADAPASLDQGYQQRLPMLFKALRIVRGGC